MRRTRPIDHIEGAEVAGLWGSAPRDGRSMDLTALDRLGLEDETPRGWSTEHVVVRDAKCTSVLAVDKSTRALGIVRAMWPFQRRGAKLKPPWVGGSLAVK